MTPIFPQAAHDPRQSCDQCIATQVGHADAGMIIADALESSCAQDTQADSTISLHMRDTTVNQLHLLSTACKSRSCTRTSSSLKVVCTTSSLSTVPTGSLSGPLAAASAAAAAGALLLC